MRPTRPSFKPHSLAETIELPTPRVTVLHTLRRKRNISDYTGEYIDDSSVEHCRVEAERLLNDVEGWLKENRPDLSGS